jgi:hypothetical protein
MVVWERLNALSPRLVAMTFVDVGKDVRSYGTGDRCLLHCTSTSEEGELTSYCRSCGLLYLKTKEESFFTKKLAEDLEPHVVHSRYIALRSSYTATTYLKNARAT